MPPNGKFGTFGSGDWNLMHLPRVTVRNVPAGQTKTHNEKSTG